MSTLPDNRFVLSPTKIDFENDVGTTGQTHDNYPAGGQQARYDWFRMAVIALLSSQSSHYEPINFRVGSPWFDLNELRLKFRTGEGTAGTEWSSIADVIGLGDATAGTTLSAWYQAAAAALAAVWPPATYSGRATAETVYIPIPESIRAGITAETRAWVWVNGLLRDPRNCSIEAGCPTKITLTESLSDGDKFTVKLEKIVTDRFILGDVLAT